MTSEDGHRKQRVCMTLDGVLVSRIDAEKGLASRSRYVEHLLRTTLAERVS